MFTWLPVVYMTSLAVLDETIPIELSVFSIYMIGLSGAIDPLLYALLLKDFRLTLYSLKQSIISVALLLERSNFCNSKRKQKH